MIESILVRRLSAITMFVALATAALALSLGSARVAGGAAAGALLGLLPIWSWSWMGALILPGQHRAEAPQKPKDRNGAKADSPGATSIVLVTLVKFTLYGIALFALISRNLVDPLAFAAALLAPGFLMAAMLTSRRAGASR